MALTIARNDLLAMLATFRLFADGDDHEKRYWHAIEQHFSNYEQFWRQFVVPMTRRIEAPIGDPNRHHQRPGVAADLWRISYLSYTLFLQLTHAYDHLSLPLNSSFNDFYAHLGSVCDLADEFFLAVYVLVALCRGEPIRTMELMTEAEFIEIARNWYRRDYNRYHRLYHSKGKAAPIYLPARQFILLDYFSHDDQSVRSWRSFAELTKLLRPYRNRIIHDVAIGTIVTQDGANHLVPRKEVINRYPDMNSISRALMNPAQVREDFVPREVQMSADWHELQANANELWRKPDADFGALLQEQNPKLLHKYDLVLT